MKQYAIATTQNSAIVIEQFVTGSTQEINKLVSIIYNTKYPNNDHQEVINPHDHNSIKELFSKHNVSMPVDNTFLICGGLVNTETLNAVLVFSKEPINLQ